MENVAGVDGCKGGWVVVIRNVATGAIDVRGMKQITDVVGDPTLHAIGIDVPIGLPEVAERGGRRCDQEARQFLGPRRSSVFSAPIRSVIRIADYAEAARRTRSTSPHGLSLSRQSHAICKKIEEVDRVVRPDLQRRLFEVHPELSFAAMQGDQPLAVSKHSLAGEALRIELLQRVWGCGIEPFLQRRFANVRAKRDDILDAMAACWTAERVLRGTAKALPEVPQTDARGLRMEIVR